MPNPTDEQLKNRILATGQQPVSASVLSTPAVPVMPQPTPTSIPTATLPSLQDIFALQDTALSKEVADTSRAIGDTSAAIANEGAYRTQQEQSVDIAGKKQTVNDLTNRFNTLKAQEEQIPLQLQEDSSGRGITTGGLAPIQAGELRKSRIQQLGVSAMLNAANGNLSTALDQIETAVNATFAPLRAKLEAQKAQLAAITPLLQREDSQRDKQQAALLAERSRMLDKAEEDQRSIYETMLKAAENGADAVTLRKIQNAATPEEAATAAGTVLGAKFQQDKKQQEFENNIKLAQLAIDERKATNESVAISDPTQILAYAQQYATDGKIPTGLPKGTFGIVSQVAKELPKPDGTLVANTTGISPSNLSATQTDGITALYDLQSKLDRAKELFNSMNTGLLAGTKNAVLPSKTAQQYNDLKLEISDLLARARTGAAINTNEERIYNDKLPGAFNKTLFLGGNGVTKIDDLKASLSGKLNSSLKVNNVSIYGYSKVNLGGTEFTVGQTVTNSAGQQGRINADGSITLIQ